MAEVVLKKVSKRYDNGFEAVKDVTLEIEPQEFIILVGPSGCGKSTTLRMIAGLEDITEGELWLKDTLANFMEPRERELAMVFQNYALYPNMTVYKNLAFSLEIRAEEKRQIKAKVAEVAKLLGIEDLLHRRPKDLSGGQRQRVAIGNAIIRNPELLLMDEPLSNLDAKLRAQMRVELAKLHKTLGSTIIYVTHDQTEAMTLGTKIVVMNHGKIQQADTPTQLYYNPLNRFVAGFIGSPSMNFLTGSLEKTEGRLVFRVGDDTITCSEMLAEWIQRERIYGRVELGIRPEAFLDGYRREQSHRDDLTQEQQIVVEITHRELLGNETLLYFQWQNTECCVKADAHNSAQKGDYVLLWLDTNQVSLFDCRTGENLLYKYRLERTYA